MGVRNQDVLRENLGRGRKKIEWGKQLSVDVTLCKERK